MTDVKQSISERFRWLAFPLLAFTASRALLYGFARSAPLFGPAMGTDGPGLLKAYPTWAALAHGETAQFARIARQGYVTAADASCFPFLVVWGRLVGDLAGSIEATLLLTSLLMCALGFVAVYRVFERLRGTGAARAGVGLLAAFPFAYHLSDGGSLAALLAFSAWGILLTLQGRTIASTAVLSVGVLAHPLCALTALAAPSLAGWGQEPSRKPRLSTAGAILLPVFALAAWMLHLRTYLTGRLAWSAFLSGGNLLRPEARALLVALGVLLAVGGLLAARWRGLRLLAVAGGLQLGLVAATAGSFSVHALAALWPLFLGWSDVLGKRPSLRIPAIAMCAAHQGLLLYCYTRFFPFA